jgi:hypothetical protein
MTSPVAHYPRTAVAIVSLLILAACNPKPQPDFVFNTQDLSQKEVRRADAECRLEAEKAAMRAKNSVTAGENSRKIFILCMEAKGAQYRGTTDELPDVKRKPI